MSTPVQTPVPSTTKPLVVLDASVWVSYLVLQDTNHVPARTWLQTFIGSGGQLAGPMILVVETAAALSRLTGAPMVAHNAIAHLHNFAPMNLIPLEQSLVDEAADTAADLGLRAADAMYVALAKRLGVPLVTFDQEQITKTAAVISTVQP